MIITLEKKSFIRVSFSWMREKGLRKIQRLYDENDCDVKSISLINKMMKFMRNINMIHKRRYSVSKRCWNDCRFLICLNAFAFNSSLLVAMWIVRILYYLVWILKWHLKWMQLNWTFW